MCNLHAHYWAFVTRMSYALVQFHYQKRLTRCKSTYGVYLDILSIGQARICFKCGAMVNIRSVGCCSHELPCPLLLLRMFELKLGLSIFGMGQDGLLEFWSTTCWRMQIAIYLACKFVGPYCGTLFFLLKAIAFLLNGICTFVIHRFLCMIIDPKLLMHSNSCLHGISCMPLLFHIHDWCGQRNTMSNLTFTIQCVATVDI